MSLTFLICLSGSCQKWAVSHYSFSSQQITVIFLPHLFFFFMLKTDFKCTGTKLLFPKENFICEYLYILYIKCWFVSLCECVCVSSYSNVCVGLYSMLKKQSVTISLMASFCLASFDLNHMIMNATCNEWVLPPSVEFVLRHRNQVSNKMSWWLSLFTEYQLDIYISLSCVVYNIYLACIWNIFWPENI